MNLDLIFLNGYGQFVWPAFIFTFVNCYYLYLKTSKELQRQEKLFLKEYGQLRTTEVKAVRQKTKEKKIISVSSAF